MNIVLLETQSLGDDVDLSCFERLGSVTKYSLTSKEEVAGRVEDADIVVANKAPMCEDTLKDAKNLKLIALTATGTNNIDFDYMKLRGIKVANVKGYSTMSVVQHTFALLFYVYEKMRYYDEYVKLGGYCKSPVFSVFDKKFNELAGKKFTVVGLGDIGSKVIEVAKAFGCDVRYYSTTGNNNNSLYKRVSFDEMIKESDIISIHAPLNETTKNMFGIEQFRNMKKEAVILNLGRGGIINEKDLAIALKEEMIAGAGIDVVEVEPIREDNPLLEIKDSTKLVITPHIGWATLEARTRVIEEVYLNIESFSMGENRNIVN